MKKYLKIIILAILITILLFIIINQDKILIGDVLLDIKEKYSTGEKIKGNLNIKISEGELIPIDSKVIVSFAGEEQEFTLYELTNSDTLNGEFYAQDTSLSGEGKGYGKIGSVTTYPEINFELEIYDSSNKEKEKEDKKEKSKKNIETSDVTEEDTEEPSEENSEESESEETGYGSTSPITGAVISETTGTSGTTISGTVSKNEKFTYKKEKSETAEIVSGSVNIDNEEIDESNLKLNLQNKKLTVTTKYSVTQEGFGKEYLGKKKKQLSISLKKFNFIANEDSTINIKLVYKNEIFVEATKAITVEQEENNTTTNQTEINETETTTNETEINETITNPTMINNTESNQTASNRTITLEDITINISQDRAILKEPVRWKRTINLSDAADLVVELPLSATNITINKILKIDNTTSTSFISGRAISQHQHKKHVRINIHGKVTVEIDDEEPILIKWFKNLFGITGHVISQDETNTKEILIETDGTEKTIEIQYETPAPYAVEEIRTNSKRVIIIGPTGIHYNKVLAFTNLSENLNITNPNYIQIFWIENNSFISQTNLVDLNNNSIYDYVEWIVPRLSNQTFNITLNISNQDTPNQPNTPSNSGSGGNSGGSKTLSSNNKDNNSTTSIIETNDPITIAQAREHDIGYNYPIIIPKKITLFIGLAIGLLILLLIIILLRKNKNQKKEITKKSTNHVKEEKQILKEYQNLNKNLKKHEINIEKLTKKYEKQLEKARKKELKNKKYLPYIQSTTLKEKFKKPFTALRSLFKSSKHHHKKGVVLIDGKIIEVLKEKAKGQDLKGKYIEIKT